MLSSLIFVALAAAWLIVLVPMFARRRQEVARTNDTALAARVVRRGGDRRSTAGGLRKSRVKEALTMPDTERDDAGRTGMVRQEEVDDEPGVESEVDGEFEHDEDGQRRRIYSDDARAGRRYRPGRGGFDPEAAALAARTKYARRQRIVLTILVVAVLTAVVAAMFWSVMWWGHALADVVLVGYLSYLRRQVRIEEDVRARRLARLSGESASPVDDVDQDEDEYEEYEEYEGYDTEEYEDIGGREGSTTRGYDRRRETGRTSPSGAVVLGIDDEDPVFDELDERTWEPYRRASGE